MTEWFSWLIAKSTPLLAAISPKLTAAYPAEREQFEISPSGYGNHWPLLDELLIDELLGITQQPLFRQSKAAEQKPVR